MDIHPRGSFDHPSGDDLYNYFSVNPSDKLSREDRERIALHIAMCNECAGLGKDIEEDDRFLSDLVSTPPTTEDQAAMQRSLERFRHNAGHK